MKKEHRVHGIFIFVLLVLFLAYEDILRVSPQVMKKQLFQSIKVSTDSLGLMGAFTLFIYLLLQVPIGAIYDRISTRFVIPLVIFICALGAFFFGWSYNIYFASLAKAMMAFSSPFAFIGSLIVAERWFSHRHFAFLAGTSQMVGAFGILIAGVPVEALLQYYTSWRVVMIMLGTIGLVLALMCLMIMRDNPQERFIVPHKHQYGKQLKKIFLSKQTWWAATYALLGWGPMVVFAGTWGGPYFQKRYMISVEKAAAMIALSWLGLGIVSPIMGWFSDYIGKRLPLLYYSSALGVICSLLLIFTPGSSLIFAGVLLFGLGAAAAGQILTFPIVKECTLPTSLGMAVGLNNMAAVLGGIVTQALAGAILFCFPSIGTLYSLTAYRIAFLVVPICFIFAFIVSVYFLKETYCKQYEGE